MSSLISGFDGAEAAAGMIAEAVHWDRPNHEAVRHAEYLEDVLRRFRQGLVERGIEDFYERDVALIKHPLTELKKFLNAEPSDLQNVSGAYIFAWFVRQRLSDLENLAREIDADSAA